jgi:hypothetical protein
VSNFKKLNEAEVVSPDGFKVKYGRDSLTYSDAGKYLIVPIDHLGAPYEMAVYLGMASEWMEKGTSTGRPSESDLDEVEQRIRDSLSYLQRNYSITR